MTTLRIISDRTSDEIGHIDLAGDGSARFSDEAAEGIFRQYQRVTGWTDRETFDKLATGWSNGYVTIPALTKP